MTAWVVQTCVISAVMAGAMTILSRVTRIGPVAMHALWTVVLVKLLVPPVFVVPVSLPAPIALESSPQESVSPETPPARIEFSPEVVPVGGGLAARSLSDEQRRPDGFASGTDLHPPARRSVPLSVRHSTGLALLLSWLVGSVAFLTIQTIRILRLAKQVRAGRDPDPAFAALVQSVADQLHIRGVSCRVIEGLDSPVMWCLRLRHPVLLWPAHLSVELSDRPQRALIVHELAHLKRRDHWTGWAELVAGVAWWWNPVFWYTRARVRENAELACDGWVVETLPGGRRAYAEALLTICIGRDKSLAPIPALGAGASNRKTLERRLTMIMKGKIPLRLPRVGLLSVATLGLIALPAWAQRPQEVSPARTVVTTQAVPVEIIEIVQQQPAVVSTAGQPQKKGIVQSPAKTVRAQTVYKMQGKLPEDAQKLIDQFNEKQKAAEQEMEAKLKQQRDDLVKELQGVQDSYAKGGKLDEAIAVRDYIRMLESNPARFFTFGGTTPFYWTTGSTATAAFPSLRYERLTPKIATTFPATVAKSYRGVVWTGVNEPFSAAQLRGHVGATVTLEVTGATGEVWGTDTYTDDSSIAAAAVHAGILKVGEKGRVTITIAAGQDNYSGSTRNGITSQTFGHWDGSFKIEKAK